jgi:hypothetical protein
MFRLRDEVRFAHLTAPLNMTGIKTYGTLTVTVAVVRPYWFVEYSV